MRRARKGTSVWEAADLRSRPGGKGAVPDCFFLGEAIRDVANRRPTTLFLLSFLFLFCPREAWLLEKPQRVLCPHFSSPPSSCLHCGVDLLFPDAVPLSSAPIFYRCFSASLWLCFIVPVFGLCVRVQLSFVCASVCVSFSTLSISV